jgi:hypothetical protein
MKKGNVSASGYVGVEWLSCICSSMHVCVVKETSKVLVGSSSRAHNVV